MSDAFTDALNSPSGRLAQILLKKIPNGKGEISAELRRRLDRLVDMSGSAGVLARVRLAADVPFLFERSPEWTEAKMLPIFDWSSPDALDAWSARKYSRWIGSPKLFGLLKSSFLTMFTRNDVSNEDLTTFADWLGVIIIANQKTGAGYPLDTSEVRAALRLAGKHVMVSIAHRFAIEMEAAKPADKLDLWRNVIGPSFKATWPLDVDLQSSASANTSRD
jgi:hypothetical protein